MTGLDVCRALGADPRTAGVAILMLSGWAFPSDIAAGHAAGADAYMSKSYSAAALSVQADQLIEQARSRVGTIPAEPAVPVDLGANLDAALARRQPGTGERSTSTT